MRRLLAFIAKAAVSGLLLYLAVAGLPFEDISGRLRNLHVEWALAAVALAGVQLIFFAARWQRIAHWCDAPLSFGRGFRFGLIATFLNQVLPSTIGGDA